MFENHGYYILGTSYPIFFRTTFIYVFETHSEKAPVINVHFWKLPNTGVYSKTPDFLQTMGHKSWLPIAPSRIQMSLQDKRLSPSPGSSLIVWIAATKQQYNYSTQLILRETLHLLGFQVEIGFRANNKISDIGMMGCFHKGINNWFLTIKIRVKSI
jgi:hypothetical protein